MNQRTVTRRLASMPATAAFLAMVATVACLLAPVPAGAEGAASTRGAVGLLDRRIDLKITKAAADDLFRTFAEIAGLKPDIDPAVKGEVSLLVENVRFETALNAACESAGCRWRIADGTLRVEPLPEVAEKEAGKETDRGLDAKIDLKVSQADVHNLLETFAQLLGAKLGFDPAVAGKVTLNLENTSCRDGLDAICRQAGCTWKLGEGEKPALEVAKR